MKEPVLVIMAAGMGSRYGGLKQIDAIDEYGHIIIDFSIYDAIKAGFKKVVFIIKRENENDFKKYIVDRVKLFVETEFVYQDIDNLPEGYQIPEGRVKPWGTGHAILSCLGRVDGPFAVINADDYYGRDAFKEIYNFLINIKDDDKYRYAMVGYKLENTLTDNGFVSRGVCETENDNLIGITERTHIEKVNGRGVYLEKDLGTYVELPENATVSMNMWGFTKSILDELNYRFVKFLNMNITENPLKSEFFLPSVVGELLEEKKATVRVLRSLDKWYGITYKEDKETVINAIKLLKAKGVYPEMLWKTADIAD